MNQCYTVFIKKNTVMAAPVSRVSRQLVGI